MPMPKSVVKIKKNGVEYISNVDRVQYTINELTRAALKDVAKLLRKRIIQKIQKLKGLRGNLLPYWTTQYWVRKRETDLQIGFKTGSWYDVWSEFGTKLQPRRGFLRDTVFENIDEIRRIEGKYLSAIEDENRALGLLDEEEDKDQGVTDGDQ